MSFEIDVTRKLGARTLRFSFHTDARLTAIVGPSGAGKTSLLNMVAGLMKPDMGRIIVAGETLFDSARRIHLPPEKRRIGYVFQDGRLFPHMRVEENLSYGMKARRGAGVSGMRLEDILGFLGITHLRERWPATLSGGEAQRVAIGRALLSGPRFLLMDEPLGALDAALREDAMRLIERLRDELALPILYVSHDRAEVERLSDTIISI